MVVGCVVLTVHLGYDACAIAKADEASEVASVVAVKAVRATRVLKENFMSAKLLSCPRKKQWHESTEKRV